MQEEVKHYKVKSLGTTLRPNSVYYVKPNSQTAVLTYITDQTGVPYPLIDLTGVGNIQTVTGTGVTGTLTNPVINISTFNSSQLGNLIELSSTDGKLFVKPITSPDGSISIVNTLSELQIEVSEALQEQIQSALQPGDNVSELINDAEYVTSTELEGYLPLEGGTMDADADIIFANGSKISEGIVDAGTGGNKGIALTCSVGYEWKWEAGEAYLTNLNYNTIDAKIYSRNAPTQYNDESKGFVFGSYWYTLDGRKFYCSDPTTDNAIWDEILETLQTITDNGSITTNPITVGDAVAGKRAEYRDLGVVLYNEDLYPGEDSGAFTLGQFQVRDIQTNNDSSITGVVDSINNFIGIDFRKIGKSVRIILPTSLIGTMTQLILPSKTNGNYTIATLEDIPSAITIDANPTDGSSNAVSSNGVFDALANKEPNITAGTTSQYWRGDKTWQTFPTIPTVGTWGALNYPTWTTGTPFVKMTAAGTFALDTNTYLTSAVTSVGATSPITSSGGNTPTISTSMATNKLIGRSTAGVGVMEEITVGSGLTLTGAGVLNNTATPTPTGYYGAFSDVTDQFAAVINTGYPMLLGLTDLSNQVTVVSGSRVTIANTGIYNIQWSAQFNNPTSLEHNVTIWLRKNGVDVPGSSGIVLVPPKHGSFDGHILPSWNFLLDVVAGDYYEFVWSTENISVFISFAPAGNPPPSTASVVLTVTQQAGIMAGTGITAINSLTGAAQTLTTGTTGTDFAINSTTSTHTFNLPTASATNRGALSSTDWSTFNGKQDRVSGVSDTEISYLDGVTSSIQTQIDNLVELNFLRQNVGYIIPAGLVNIQPSFNVSPNLGSWALVTSGATATGGIGGFVRFDTTATAGTLAFRRGSFGIILGGYQFEYTQKVRFQTNLTGQRGLWGLSPAFTFATPTNVEPNTNINVVGVCQLSTSTNLHILHNDGSGIATTVDLGVNYPCNTNIYTYYVRIKRTLTDYTITVERLTNTDNSIISTVYTTSTNIPAFSLASFSPINYITNNAQAIIASYFDGGCIAKVTHQ